MELKDLFSSLVTSHLLLGTGEGNGMETRNQRGPGGRREGVGSKLLNVTGNNEKMTYRREPIRKGTYPGDIPGGKKRVVQLLSLPPPDKFVKILICSLPKS